MKKANEKIEDTNLNELVKELKDKGYFSREAALLQATLNPLRPLRIFTYGEAHEKFI